MWVIQKFAPRGALKAKLWTSIGAADRLETPSTSAPSRKSAPVAQAFVQTRGLSAHFGDQMMQCSGTPILPETIASTESDALETESHTKSREHRTAEEPLRGRQAEDPPLAPPDVELACTRGLRISAITRTEKPDIPNPQRNLADE